MCANGATTLVDANAIVSNTRPIHRVIAAIVTSHPGSVNPPFTLCHVRVHGCLRPEYPSLKEQHRETRARGQRRKPAGQPGPFADWIGQESVESAAHHCAEPVEDQRGEADGPPELRSVRHTLTLEREAQRRIEIIVPRELPEKASPEIVYRSSGLTK